LHCIHRQSKCCRLNKCLPSRLTNFSFQPLALSLRNLHKFSEKPFHELVARQDTSPSSLWQASLQLTWFTTSREVFGHTNTWDLLRLTLWPEMLQNLHNVWRITLAWYFVALAKSMRSSAKNKWDIRGPPLEATTRHRSLRSTFLEINAESFSIHSTNR
jgi:hypothetical protein